MSHSLAIVCGVEPIAIGSALIYNQLHNHDEACPDKNRDAAAQTHKPI